MNKKNFLKSVLLMVMAVMLSVGITSCGGDDNPVSTPPTTNNGNGNNGSGDNGSQDPEGTVVINMSPGSTGNFYDIGLVRQIHIDPNNNFVTENRENYHVEFASLGKVNGLSQVTTPPASGWTQSIAVVAGHGYMVRSMYGSTPYGTYARLYVVEQNSNGATTVKYQSPYCDFPFSFEETSVELAGYYQFRSYQGYYHSYDHKSITIINGTSAIEIEEKPDWCSASIYSDYYTGCYLYIQESESNDTGVSRTGKIVLKNTVCTQTLTVTQKPWTYEQ